MLSKRFDNLTPYTAGEQPRDKQYLKLNTNENPYPPSPLVAEYLKTYDTSELTLYPDPFFTDIRHELGQYYGIDPKNVFLGNGSDEILSFCFYAFFEDVVFFPEHTYSFYPVYSDFYNISFKRIPLRPDYSIDLDGFLGIDNCGGVIIANPNSPTGMYLEPKEIERFLELFGSDRVVVVDEAYIDFGGESCLSLTKDFKNLIVVHTYSKSRCAAGLRLGFAIGNQKLIDALFAVKNSFNSYPVHTLAQKIGARVLQDKAYFTDICGKIIFTREWFSKSLQSRGWQVLPSRANFIFARKPDINGSEIYRKMKELGILVRHFNHSGIEDFVRVSIGTDEQMQTFIDTVDRL